MEKLRLRDHIVGWGLLGLCCKQGITTHESVSLLESQICDPKLRPIFLELILECEKNFGSLPLDFKNNLIPPSAAQLMALGWSVGCLDLYAPMVTSLLKLRLSLNSSHQDHRRLIWLGYFKVLYEAHLSLHSIFYVLKTELNFEEYDEVLLELNQRLTQEEALLDVFANFPQLFDVQWISEFNLSKQASDPEAFSSYINKFPNPDVNLSLSYSNKNLQKILFYETLASAFTNEIPFLSAFSKALEQLSEGDLRNQWQNIISAMTIPGSDPVEALQNNGISSLEFAFLRSGLYSGSLDRSLLDLSKALKLCELEVSA